MKTKESIQNQINQLRKIKEKDVPSRNYKKAQKEAEFLSKCVMYIETDPSEQFCKKQRGIVETKIETEKHKQVYDKIMETAKLRLQLRTLNYILG